MTTVTTTNPAATKLRAWLVRWDTLLGVLVIVVLIWAAVTTPGFTASSNIADSISLMSEKALMVLPLVLLIIAREIDISVASMAGLSACVAGMALRAGLPLAVAVLAALLVGLVCGAFNGFCVTVLGMPSLVVTLGTLALYRGLCYVLLHGNPISTIPTPLLNLGSQNLPGLPIPQDIIPFLVLAPIFALTLHLLPTGRRIYAIGGEPETARYAGVRSNKIRFGLFLVSGLVCSIAGIINIGRTSAASPDGLLGYELDAITVVFLGGVAVLGGKGRMTGVLWALTLLIALRSALQLHNVAAYAQGTAVGLLLIFSLLISNIARRLAAALRTRRQARLRRTQSEELLREVGALT
jgi:rhamnose transport system permease protein